MNVCLKVYIGDCNAPFVKLVSCTRQTISEMTLVHVTIII